MIVNILKLLSNLPRRDKAILLLCTDLIILGISLLMAFAVRFEPSTLLDQFRIFNIGIWLLITVQFIVLGMSGLYRSVLRHAGSELLMILLRTVLLSAGLFWLLDLMFQEIRMPRTIIVMSTSFSFLSLLSIRLIIRWLVRIHLVENVVQKKLQRVVIYGAGNAGMQLFESLRQEETYEISAFVDDNPKLQGSRVREKLILSFDGLQTLHSKNPIDWILLALPTVKNEQRKKIIQKIIPLKVGVRVLPTINQLMNGTSEFMQLQEVGAADLLGRDEIAPYPDLIDQDIKGRNILVTGAGGSIGSELCREILRASPKSLILLESNELSLYKTEISLSKLTSISIIPCLGSVSDFNLVKNILKNYKIQTVYHTAAYKHVPLVEENPITGIQNNVFGTHSIVDNCTKSKVSPFVLISTDKAVRPANVMGASKRIAEMIVQNKAQLFPELKFGIVRFGNVLDSSGSVVPIFREQIKKRLPITITHPEMTRYFMSIGEAARLVIQAGAMASKGEIFLLDMGDPVKIKDLALQMIKLSGLIPEKDVTLKYTGLRPGEKLYEELLIDAEKSKPTRHPRIFSSEEPSPENKVLDAKILHLGKSISKRDLNLTMEILKSLVPEYNPVKET